MDLKEYHIDNQGLIFHVTSERDKNITYIVAVDDLDGWFCSCEDYQFRKHKCKHIKQVTNYLKEKYPSEYNRYNKLEVYQKIRGKQ